MRSRKTILALATALALIGPVLIGPVRAQTAPLQPAAPLEQGFKDPPNAARPRVWWHWMNGNITREGIAKDIAWMADVGIGGLQNFDVDLSTARIVDHRLAYMTPPWRDAFRFAAQEAQARGLELAIASSPGWSETGGPWVAPGDAMKKLVWSQTDVTGAGRCISAWPRRHRWPGPINACRSSPRFPT
jgi:hypothetical protein